MARRSTSGNAELVDYAQSFSLLSDATRLGILQVLARGPRNVTALCEALGLRQPTVSHHLGLLRMGRLVHGERQGKSVVYHTLKDNLRELSKAMDKFMPKK